MFTLSGTSWDSSQQSHNIPLQLFWFSPQLPIKLMFHFKGRPVIHSSTGGSGFFQCHQQCWLQPWHNENRNERPGGRSFAGAMEVFSWSAQSRHKQAWLIAEGQRQVTGGGSVILSFINIWEDAGTLVPLNRWWMGGWMEGWMGRRIEGWWMGEWVD